MDFRAAVEKAADYLYEAAAGGRLGGWDVLFLLPPGNARTDVAELFCRRWPNCAVFTYKKGAVEAAEISRHIQSGGRAVVVPKDMAEAASSWTEVKGKKKAVFLPAVYEELLKKEGLEAEEWQRADYGFSRQLFHISLWPSGAGVHLSAVGRGDLRACAEPLLYFRPSNLAKRQLGVDLGEVAEDAASLLLTAALATSPVAAAGLFVKAAGEVGVKIAELVTKWGARALGRAVERLRGAVERPEALRLGEMAEKAGEAIRCFDLCEALACQIAAMYKMTCDEFKKALEALAAIDPTQQEEYRQRLAQYLKAVEERVKALEDQVAELKSRIGEAAAAFGFYLGEAPLLREGGSLWIREGVDRFRLVEEGGFADFGGELFERLRRGGVVVLHGPRGSGKSALALYIATRWAEEVGPVAIVKDVKNIAQFYDGLGGAQAQHDELRKMWLVVVDPSPHRIYKKPAKEKVGGLSAKVRGLIRLTPEDVRDVLEFAQDYHVPTLLLLTSEEYDEYVHAHGPLEGAHPVPHFEKEFYREVVLSYGVEKARAMPREDLDALVAKVVEYKAGTALVAKYVGLAIASVIDPRDALEKGKGDAKRFLKAVLAHFLKSGLEKPELLRMLYVAKWVAAGVAPLRYVFTPGLVRKMAEWGAASRKGAVSQAGAGLGEEGANILARINEDLVEEALADLLGFKTQDGELVVPQDWLDNTLKWLADVAKEFAEEVKVGKMLLEKEKEEIAKLIGLALLGHLKAQETPPEDLEALKHVRELTTHGDVITPGVILLIHLAAGHGVPLADPEEACRRLPEKIERGKTLQDLAVLAAYAAALLTVDERPAGCMERALYALHWSLGHVGPLADLALGTAFSALERAGAVEGAPQTLWTILNGYGERPGVCQRALSLLRKLYKGDEGKRPAYLAYLAEAYAAAASRCYDEEAARRAEELLQKLDGQWRTLAAEAYFSLAHWFSAAGQLDEAEKYADQLEKHAEELVKLADGLREGGGGAVGEYFKWRSLGPPEETARALAEGLLSAAAELRGHISLGKYVRGLAEAPDAEAFKKTAEAEKQRYEKFESPGAFRNYLAAKGHYGSVLFIIGRAGEALQVFREAWEEASKKLWPDASYLEVVADSLVHYAAALIHQGRVEEAKTLLEKRGGLLPYSPRGSAAFYLWSKALGVDVVEEPPDLTSVLLDGVRDFARPAVLHLLTGQHDAEACANACGEDSKCHSRCELFLKAAAGDAEAAEKVRMAVVAYVERGYRSVGSMLERLSVSYEDFRIFGVLNGSGLVEVYAPRHSFGLMLFFFRALGRGDLELAKAHALWGALEAPRLFAEVYNALRGASTVEETRRRPEYKTALTKLLLYHV